MWIWQSIFYVALLIEIKEKQKGRLFCLDADLLIIFSFARVLWQPSLTPSFTRLHHPQWSSSLIVFRSSSRLSQVFKTSPVDRPPNVQLWKPLYPSRDWKWNLQCDWSLMLVKPQKPCALVSPPSLGPWPWDDDDGVMVKPLLPPMLTCQLMRLDRFSTTRRYSVRVGGPYL